MKWIIVSWCEEIVGSLVFMTTHPALGSLKINSLYPFLIEKKVTKEDFPNAYRMFPIYEKMIMEHGEPAGFFYLGEFKDPNEVQSLD